MTLHRYAITVIALAACQFALAQVPAAGGAAAGVARPPFVLNSDGTRTNLVSGTPAVVPQDAEAQAPEPRILRGNDRVIASPSKGAAAFTGAPVSFGFEEAPVPEVVRTILGDVLKVDYVLHPPLSGTVTLSTRAPVSPDQAAFLLESALQANGLALARDARGTYHVGRPEVIRNIGAVSRQVGREPLPPGYGAIIVPLQYIGAGEMAQILRPMLPAESLVRVDTVRNLLILAGSRSQAEGWLDLVATFDVDLLKGMSVGVFPLKYASIKEVETALQLVGGSAGAGASGGAAASPGARPGTATVQSQGQGAANAAAVLGEGNPLFGALRIMPIERLNSILVVTPRASYLEEARRWIEKLDQPSDNSAESQLFIYRVQNGNARHLASLLTGIFGDGKQPVTGNATSGVAPGLGTSTGMSSPFGNTTSSSSPFSSGAGGTTGLGLRSGGLQAAGRVGGTTSTGAGAAGTANTANTAIAATLGGVRVMADELNNVVLVWGSRTEYSKIEATLKRLDLPPTQVLIEASIVEVTLNDDLQYGLQWAFSDSRSTTGSTGRGVLTTSDTGLLAAAGRGFSYTLRNSAGSVRAVLSALAAKTSVKVVASPTLMVLDNHTAAIAVGNQQPIKAGETVSAEGSVRSTNIQYKDTGVNLMVTPSVNSGNIVTMQVDQSVTDLGTKDEITGQLAFLQRQISSKVAVRSGEAIVMGGLIQENATANRSGVPILQDIPLLGSLFSTTTNGGRRTELLVVITPRVVRSDIDVREVSEDLRDRMKGLTRMLEKAAQPKSLMPNPAVPQ
jgi:general secretion pathway protein D